MHGPIYPMYTTPPTQKILAADLLWAIKSHDMESARRTFDTAFWRNIDFKPDWHHFFCAVVKKEPDMLRLLEAHGAKWSAEDARHIQVLFPDEWPEFQKTIDAAGIRMDAALSAPDMERRVHMSRRICEEDAKLISTDTLRKRTDRLLSQAVSDALLKGDQLRAGSMMRLRQPTGELGIENELGAIAGNDYKAAFRTLEQMRKEGYWVGQVQLPEFVLRAMPEIVAETDKRGLLSADQPHRLALLGSWSLAAAENWPLYKDAALRLFRTDKPVTAAEAEEFIKIYKDCPPNQASAMEQICHTLLESTKFFVSAGWTESRLHDLNDSVRAETRLKKVFNARLAHDKFSRLPASLLATPQYFAALAEAHQKGYYQSHSEQTQALLVEISRNHKNGDVPAAIADGLRVMKENGAVFQQGFLESYFGSKEPGLVKILLDLGVFPASLLDGDGLRRRAHLPEGGNALNPQKHHGKYVEFFAQVALEKEDPAAFIPLRGQNISYAAKYAEKHLYQAPKSRIPHPDFGRIFRRK